MGTYSRIIFPYSLLRANKPMYKLEHKFLYCLQHQGTSKYWGVRTRGYDGITGGCWWHRSGGFAASMLEF